MMDAESAALLHTPRTWAGVLIGDETQWVYDRIRDGWPPQDVIEHCYNRCAATEWLEPAWLGRLALASQVVVIRLVEEDMAKAGR